MKIHEKVELFLIPLCVGGVFLSSPVLPSALPLGTLITVSALLLLIQGFFRDLYFLYLQKTVNKGQPVIEMRCMCLESTIGLPLVLAGVGLSLLFPGLEVPMNSLSWTLLTAVVMGYGFYGKDLVVSWSPFGIRREPEHHRIKFRL